MKYKVVLSKMAFEELEQITAYIALDNVDAAKKITKKFL